MNDEYERAKINLENLRNDLARFTHDRDHAINLIELRKADIARAEEHLKWAKYPAYDRQQGVARRVYLIDEHFITLRWDLGRMQEFRRTDGGEKYTHRRSDHGERIDVPRAVALWVAAKPTILGDILPLVKQAVAA